MSDRYRQVLRFVSETQWAIRPSMLAVIRDMVEFRVQGGRLDAEEIEQRIGARRTPDKPAGGGSVAVLPLWGVLVPHAGMMIDVSTAGTGLDAWLDDFRELADDRSIGAIVLDVNSPGGSVDLVAEVAAEIRAARNRKTIVAVTNTDAASAAYWIASQASELVVTPSGAVGSIGVFAAHEDISQALEAEGVKVTLVSAGEHKTEGNPFEPLSDEARATIQKHVDAYYGMFVDDVAKGRGVGRAVVEETFGQGRMVHAAEAVRLGMADRVGTVDQTVARLVGGNGTQRARAETDQSMVIAESGSVAPDLPGIAASVSLGSSSFPAGSGITFDLTEETGAASGASAKQTKEVPPMERAPTAEERAARRTEIEARMNEMVIEWQGREFDDPAQAEFDGLKDEIAAIKRVDKSEDERREALAAAFGDPDKRAQVDGAGATVRNGAPNTNAGRRLPDDVFDLSAYRGFARSLDDLNGLYADGARRVNEHLAFECEHPDKAREHVERLLKKDTDKAEFALRILGTSSDLYDRAFGKAVLGRPLSTQEDAAIKAAVSNTGLGSETPVPVTIDPSVMLTSDGQTNPLREISRVVTITGNKWRGITSDGVSVVYDAELAQVADQTPDFESPEATVQKAHGWVEFSIEVDQDWPSFRSELAMMFQDAKDSKEAEKFLFGTGVNEPEGLIWKLDDEGSSIVYTSTLNTFDVADLYTLRGALPPRFRARAVWLGNDDLYSAVRNFDESGGSALWAQLAADRPPTLIGKSAYEASEMSGLVSTGDEQVLVYGDFSRGFVIVDRVGLNVELVSLVAGTGGRPRGSRGIYVYFRNTSQVRTVNAFRMLAIKPS